MGFNSAFKGLTIVTNTLETNLENLIVPQALIKFPAVYVTPRFITVFTTAYHVSLT
jgi:hypothetical protein